MEWAIRSVWHERASGGKEELTGLPLTAMIALNSGPRFLQDVSRLYSHLPLGYCFVSARLFALE